MEDNKNKALFSEFPPISTAQWEEVIMKDLKGADYERKLIKKTIDGISVKPYYRSQNLNDLSYLLESKPGEFPYIRGSKNDNKWLIRQDIKVGDYAQANQKALEAIEKGADSIGFVIKGIQSVSSSELSALLKDFPFGKVEMNFSARKLTKNLVVALADFFKQTGISVEKVYGSLSYDPLGCLTISGHFCEDDVCEGISFSKEIYALAAKLLPSFEILTIHANYFKNSGSGIVQELAFGLAIANEYLTFAKNEGIAINTIASKIKFNMAVGPEYFMEIAKLRAARYLWAKIVEAYEPGSQQSAKMKIHSVTAEYNKTIYDPYVNMLRSTTEAMSAILGGTDSLSVLPFNIQFDEANPFSERIARNQQIVLKKESYLDKVADPSAGSYLIENLTNSLIDETWALFLKVEEKGGYFKAFEQGFIQDEINQTVKKRNDNLANRKDILLGTNQYANTQEKAKEYIKTTPKKSGIGQTSKEKIAEPLNQHRGSEIFEKLRMATENAAKTPQVFLFTYGNLAMRKARAGFASNFFACAGFDIIDHLGYPTIQAGIEAAKKSNSDIVVICSSDDEYPLITKEIADGLKGKILVIAGYPKDSIEQLQSFGIKHFIDVKSNVLETLQSFEKELGIA